MCYEELLAYIMRDCYQTCLISHSHQTCLSASMPPKSFYTMQTDLKGGEGGKGLTKERDAKERGAKKRKTQEWEA